MCGQELKIFFNNNNNFQSTTLKGKKHLRHIIDTIEAHLCDRVGVIQPHVYHLLSECGVTSLSLI